MSVALVKGQQARGGLFDRAGLRSARLDFWGLVGERLWDSSSVVLSESARGSIVIGGRGLPPGAGQGRASSAATKKEAEVGPRV